MLILLVIVAAVAAAFAALWERWGHPNAGAMKSFYYDKRPKASKTG